MNEGITSLLLHLQSLCEVWWISVDVMYCWKIEICVVLHIVSIANDKANPELQNLSRMFGV